MEYGVFKLTQKTYCQSLQGKIPIPIAPKEILMSTPQKRNVDLIPFWKIHPTANQAFYVEIESVWEFYKLWKKSLSNYDNTLVHSILLQKSVS